MANVDHPEHWESRYQAGAAGWDLGQAPPVVTELAQALEPRTVLCPGVGKGHDAIAWAHAGHTVVGVDFAPSAITSARALSQQRSAPVQWEQADVFTLGDRFGGYFDLVWEQTFLCAISPARRSAYIDLVHTVLRPGGEVIALLWHHGAEGGPPWDLDPALARELFEPRFRVHHVEPVTSGTRKGEFLLRARPR